MDDLIVEIITQLGYFGIFILMILENLFPPMPSEAIMGAGALAIYRGEMAFWPLMIVGTLGTLIGNYAWFWVGNALGYQRLRPIIDRFGRWLTMEWEDVERATTFFARHGHWVVFGLRATPVMRTMISLPAGLAHMNIWKFGIFTAAGAALWNLMLIKGTLWLKDLFGTTEWAVSGIILATIVLSVGGYLWRLAVWKPRAER